MTDVDWLTEIKRAHGLRADADSVLVTAIVGARKAGFPWAKIGDAMGMTQQGARQHYKSHVEGK